MAVIADFDAYPMWATGVKQTEVLEADSDGRPTQVRFVLDAGPIKDEYVLAYAWEGDHLVTWTLVRAARCSRGWTVRTSSTPTGSAPG